MLNTHLIGDIVSVSIYDVPHGYIETKQLTVEAGLISRLQATVSYKGNRYSLSLDDTGYSILV